jgi:hypothetical protein
MSSVTTFKQYQGTERLKRHIQPQTFFPIFGRFLLSKTMLPRETGCGAPIKQLEDRVQLTPQMIPKSVNFDVKDSSLFKKFCALPSPEEVRAQAIAQYLAGIRPDERRTLSDDYPHWLPPVTFEDLGLFVKCGTNVRISEAQCLYALSHLLKDHVPVPEVYGWRKYGDQIFIYMGNIQGQTLEKAWNKLEVDDRVSISRELKTIFNNLRRLEQDPADPFVGTVIPAISAFPELEL